MLHGTCINRNDPIGVAFDETRVADSILLSQKVRARVNRIATAVNGLCGTR